MTIVEGQIETLKKLKESLRKNGIDRFGSVGEIRRFLRDYETEKTRLPRRIEVEIDAEIHDMRSTLASHQQAYDESLSSVRNRIGQEIQELEEEIKRVSGRRNKNIFYKVLYFSRLSSLSRKASRLKKNLEKTVEKKTSNAKKTIVRLENEIEDILKNKSTLVSERCRRSLNDLTNTKEVVDGLYTLVAGAIGETSVVSELRQLSDQYYLINDFSMEFDPPIYNKKENDRIFSVQIDHLLVSPSGVFLLETKNWSKASVESLDLRSPVKQILRTSFALFVLLNSESRLSDIRLEQHHWGAKRIPIRNLIVMISQKPKEEFKHVKVLSLNELVGYIQYFDQSFDDGEVKGIFEYLKNKMRQ